MKKIGFGTRPSEVKARSKRIDFSDGGRNDLPGIHDQQIYTPRRQPRKSGSSFSFGKILLLAAASMAAGILMGAFLLFDFSLSVDVDGVQFITGGREIEVKNRGRLNVQFGDGLKIKAITYTGLYRFLPPQDVRVEVAGIADTANRFLDDLVPLLTPEERLTYDIVLSRGGADLGNIKIDLVMGPQDWIVRADALQDKNKQIACYAKAVALDPDSADAHAALGRLYEEGKQYKQAIAEFEAVVRLKPAAVPALRSLAALYKKTGMQDRLLDTYEKLARADAGRAGDYRAQAGAIAEKSGSLDKAADIYQKLLEKDWDNVEARQKLIKIHEKNRQWNKVIDHTKVLLKLDPNNADLYLYLSDIYYKRNDVRGALAAVEKAQKLRPGDAAIFLQLAVLSEKAGKDNQAIRFYQKAVRSKIKKNPVVYNNLGMLLEKRGKRKDAITNYEIAAAMDPKNAAFAQNLADAYEKEQQWKKAAETYEKIAAMKKSGRDALEAAAVLWYKAGDKEKSLAAYRGLAKAEPKKVLWHQKLAYLYEDLNKIDEAMGEYKAILDLDPANAEAKQKRVELAKRKIKNRNR